MIMGVVEVRFLPGRIGYIAAAVLVDEIVKANTRNWMVGDHIQAGAPQIQAQKARAALRVQPLG